MISAVGSRTSGGLHGTSWDRTTSLVIAVSAALACGPKDVREISLPDEMFGTLDEGRELVDPGRIERLDQWETYDGSTVIAKGYRFSKPTMLATSGAPHCIVFVADGIDQAIHRFSPSGDDLGSLYVGGRDRPDVAGITSIAAGSDGTLLVGDGERARILRFDVTGHAAGAIALPPVASTIPAVRLAFSEDGRIFERLAAFPPSQGMPARPIRIWSQSGRQLGIIGSVVDIAGSVFAEYLNEGAMQVLADTLWYARFSDGRLLGYPIDPVRSPRPRIIEVPVFFHMSRPTQALSGRDGVLLSASTRHITDLALDPDGNFFVSETVVPGGRWALTILDRSGDVRKILDLGGNILSVTVPGACVIASVMRPEGGGTIDLIRFANPLWHHDRGVDDMHEPREGDGCGG